MLLPYDYFIFMSSWKAWDVGTHKESDSTKQDRKQGRHTKLVREVGSIG